MLNLHFFLVVRDYFKILYIQINFPACAKIFFAAILSGLVVLRKCLVKNGKKVILGHIALYIAVFRQILV